ncbi:amino acid ABC transporter permease [Spirochaeta isovalerica]|uniref:General L-amino acid transport system permease protein n=1 Tax=Spirochaeta isovalerica TaxID=150 RepID=A0A841R985_9SPIO|nr:ABC transporter permease subunit [Spirochaeta isovalerica]MBB6479590.1 general L-amino acid transport system permease protein [Spirochaeta isovalerica]
MRVMKKINVKNVSIQGALIAVLLVVCLFSAVNYVDNITRRNIGIGFGFLDDTAGFSISQTLIEYDESDTFGRTFAVGLLNTLVASFVSIVLATLLGFLVGLLRMSKNKLVSQSALVYVELLRNIPPLLHVLFWYQVVFLNILPPFKESFILGDWLYINVRGITVPELAARQTASSFNILLFISLVAIIFLSIAKKKQVVRGIHKAMWPWQLGALVLPVAFALLFKPYDIILPELSRFKFSSGMTIRPELFSIVVALSTYTSTYISEIVRSSIIAVPKGQMEAAKSLGFSPWKRLRLIIIPQALRTMIPPVTNQYLNIIKNTSLGMAVAYPDLTAVFAGTTLNQTGRALEVMVMVMLTYLSISLFTSVVMNWYNKSIIDKKGEMLSIEEIPLEIE